MAKNDGHPRSVIIVGGGKGGVGKTHKSQAVVTGLLSRGTKHPLIVHIEAEDHLGRFYEASGHYRYVEIAKDDFEKVEANPALLYASFDRMMGHIEAAMSEGHPVVIDCAANVDYALASYLNVQAGTTPLGTGEQVIFVAVTHGRNDSMKAAGSSIGYIRSQLPNANVLVLFNNIEASALRGEKDATFQGFAKKVMEEGATSVVHMDRLLAPTLLKAGDDLTISLPSLVSMELEEWQRHGIPKMVASRERSRLVTYLARIANVLGQQEAMGAQAGT